MLGLVNLGPCPSPHDAERCPKAQKRAWRVPWGERKEIYFKTVETVLKSKFELVRVLQDFACFLVNLWSMSRSTIPRKTVFFEIVPNKLCVMGLIDCDSTSEQELRKSHTGALCILDTFDNRYRGVLSFVNPIVKYILVENDKIAYAIMVFTGLHLPLKIPRVV